MKYAIMIAAAAILGACSQGENAKIRSELRGYWSCSALIVDTNPANFTMYFDWRFRIHFDRDENFVISIDTDFNIGTTYSRPVRIEGTARGEWRVRDERLEAELDSIIISSMREGGRNVPKETSSSFQEAVSRPLAGAGSKTAMELSFSTPNNLRSKFETVIRYDSLEFSIVCAR